MIEEWLKKNKPSVMFKDEPKDFHLEQKRENVSSYSNAGIGGFFGT